MGRYQGGVAALLLIALAGCQPGYMKAEDLVFKKQGPQDCAQRCHELGLQMGALVLVGDQLPGCVCQVPGNPRHRSAGEGASAGTTAYAVVLAAAAAARQAQVQQQQQQQNSYRAHH